jgi:hypothetical protein
MRRIIRVASDYVPYLDLQSIASHNYPWLFLKCWGESWIDVQRTLDVLLYTAVTDSLVYKSEGLILYKK